MLQVMKETWTMIRETILNVYIYTKGSQTKELIVDVLHNLIPNSKLM